MNAVVGNVGRTPYKDEWHTLKVIKKRDDTQYCLDEGVLMGVTDVKIFHQVQRPLVVTIELYIKDIVMVEDPT